jgi:selenocysteine lyase/cysteine desulfurase
MAKEETRAAELLVNGPGWARKAYLNTAAEGLLLRACVDAVQRYLADKATGEPGRVAMWAAHGRARELAGQLFGVPAAQVALVSSTTEALNSIANGIDWRPGDEVVFTAVEFPSNMCPWVVLARRGVRTRVVHPRDGLVSVADLVDQITPRTRLVTLSQVSYATGQHLDPGPVWERVKDTDTLLCVDATQAAGRVPVRGDRADFVVASAFKWLNSIHGAAILSVSPRALDRGVLGPAGWLSAKSCYAPDRLERFHPRPDAGRFHAGMPNFDSVYALAAALEFHTPDRVARRPGELQPLVAQLRAGLHQLGLPILTPSEPGHQAGIVAITCPASEAVKRHLAEVGVYVHGDDGRVRAALHWYNRPEHVESYLTALRELVRQGLARGG